MRNYTNDNDENIPNIYTDLAMEAASSQMDENGEVKGVKMDISERPINGDTVKITWINIHSPEGEEALGRPIGNYVTAESAAMKSNDIAAHEDIIKILVDLLGEMEPLRSAKSVLVAGLGNHAATPDALGPRVVSKLLVTRHISEALPGELETADMRSVCVIAPGVLGTTGIETAEIIKGIVDHTRPDVVIAVDALAARSAGRVNATIQFADTGLRPGSGLGPGRGSLDKETLGVPVIALGVPTINIMQERKKQPTTL